MKIGIDIHARASGSKTGLYTYLRDLVRELRPLVRDRVWLITDRHGRVPDYGPADFAELTAAFDGAKVRFVRPHSRVYRVLPFLSLCNRLDVIVHNLHSQIPPRTRAANVFVVPDVIPLGFDYGVPGTREYYDWYYELAVREADVIVVWSEHTKRDVLARVGGDPNRFRVCPLAAGQEFTPPNDPVAVQHSLAAVGLANVPYVLCVCTVEKRKNHAALLRAFDRLIRRDPALPHKLVFVGGKSTGHEEVFALAEQLGLGDRFVYLGFADSLSHLYAGADVFVFPSFYEGFGLPPLEAMACGTAVLCSNATSLPEVVGDAGELFDPNDEAGLADRLHRVLTDKDYCSTLSARGLMRAAQFTWRRTAAQYLGACQDARAMRDVR